MKKREEVHRMAEANKAFAHYPFLGAWDPRESKRNFRLNSLLKRTGPARQFSGVHRVLAVKGF